MLVTIKEFFSARLEVKQGSSPAEQVDRVHLAAAALLLEVSKADFELSPAETEQVIAALKRRFDIDPVSLDALLKIAEEEAHQASSLYQFTRLVNDFYDYEQKLMLLRSMWEVAYADGDLHKYEEHLIRKVADLIYVAHKDFVRLKLASAPTSDTAD